jgi:hypothetical protein
MSGSGVGAACGAGIATGAGAGSLAARVCAADNAGGPNAKANAHTTLRQHAPSRALSKRQ